MKNLLSTYKGLPREIYILFIGKIVNSLGVFVQPLMSLILIIYGIIPLSITTAKFMILSSYFYSISMPAYDALNADLTNENNRKNFYSLLYMGVNIGFSIGPIIGGFILKRPILILFPLMMLLYQFAYSQWTFTLPIHLDELFKKNKRYCSHDIRNGLCYWSYNNGWSYRYIWRFCGVDNC